MLGETLLEIANYAEAGLWMLVGLTCGVYALRCAGVARRRCWQAATVFLVFGLSDIVEVQTGAWWRPRWLLLWKSVCVVALFGLAIDTWRSRRNRT